MTKEERKRVILRLLSDTQLALPPKPIHVNLKMRGATFVKKTTERLLIEMAEEGLVERVRDEGYYQITEKGEQWLQGEIDLSE